MNDLINALMNDPWTRDFLVALGVGCGVALLVNVILIFI